jgi:acetyl-CoA decarbonylase/synthase complex subunit beta
MQPVVSIKTGLGEIKSLIHKVKTTSRTAAVRQKLVINRFFADCEFLINLPDDEAVAMAQSKPEMILAVLELVEAEKLFSDEHLDQFSFMKLYHSDPPADMLIFAWEKIESIDKAYEFGALWQYAKSRESLVYFFQNVVRYAYHFGNVFQNVDAFTRFCLSYMPALVILNREPSAFELLLLSCISSFNIPIWQVGERWLPDRAVPFYSEAELTDTLERAFQTNTLHYERKTGEDISVSTEFQNVWGGGYNSLFIVRSMGGTEGVDVRGEVYSDIGIVIDIGDSEIDITMTSYFERHLISLLNATGKVRFETDGWFRVQVDSRTTTLRSLGELIYDTIHSAFNIKQVSVSVVCDPYRLSALKPSILAYRESREKEISKQDDLNSPFYLCTRCRSYSKGHFCIVTSERPPHCGRTYDMIKALAHASDSSEYLPIKKGELLNRRRGEFASVNKIARLLTKGDVPRVFLHSLKSFPHPQSAEFDILAFHIPRLDCIGLMHRGFKGATPDGRTWDDLECAATGKWVSGIAAVSLEYINSRMFLAADGGAANVLWVTSHLKEKLKWHDRRIATEKECTNLTTLRNFY